jgi:hypothetical protein
VRRMGHCLKCAHQISAWVTRWSCISVMRTITGAGCGHSPIIRKVSCQPLHLTWRRAADLPARLVSRQRTAALGQQVPHLPAKDPHRVAPLTRRRVEFIRNLGDRHLQRGQTALQLGLSGSDRVELRFKIPLSHPDPLLDSCSGVPRPTSSPTVCRLAGYGIGVAMSMNVIPGSPTG